MKELTIDGVAVVADERLSEDELKQYVVHGRKKYGKITGLTVKIATDNEDEVLLDFLLEGSPFERIRRITGYLVGTLDRFNNGKRAEEHDRVKHSI